MSTIKVHVLCGISVQYCPTFRWTVEYPYTQTVNLCTIQYTVCILWPDGEIIPRYKTMAQCEAHVGGCMQKKWSQRWQELMTWQGWVTYINITKPRHNLESSEASRVTDLIWTRAPALGRKHNWNDPDAAVWNSVSPSLHKSIQETRAKELCEWVSERADGRTDGLCVSFCASHLLLSQPREQRRAIGVSQKVGEREREQGEKSAHKNITRQY